jgi:hypothetical protein
MKLIKKLHENIEKNIHYHGYSGIAKSFSDTLFFLDRKFRDRYYDLISTNVYEREWDILIILDCMTCEMVNRCVDEYSFLSDMDSIVSVGSTSTEWMEKTFTQNYLSEVNNTLYITGNTHSHDWINYEYFYNVKEVWKEGWHVDSKTVPPRRITDTAIHHHRKSDPKRMILHYMQPHQPFINLNGTSLYEDSNNMTLEELHYLEGYSREEILDAYVGNLRAVLDDIVLLLSNISGDKVVISADHGEALGEKSVWGHPRGAGIKKVNIVPWFETTATDTKEYEPDYTPIEESQATNAEVMEKLSQLGYV